MKLPFRHGTQTRSVCAIAFIKPVAVSKPCSTEHEVLEIIACNLKKRGSGSVTSAVNSQGQTIWIVNAQRDRRKSLRSARP